MTATALAARARLFAALGDPARLAMVERVAAGPVSVSALARPLSLSLAAAVQHIQILERTGLLRTEKQGRVRLCRLEPQALRTVEDWLTERRTAWNSAFDRLADLLTQPEPSRPE